MIHEGIGRFRSGRSSERLWFGALGGGWDSSSWLLLVVITHCSEVAPLRAMAAASESLSSHARSEFPGYYMMVVVVVVVGPRARLRVVGRKRARCLVSGYTSS